MHPCLKIDYLIHQTDNSIKDGFAEVYKLSPQLLFLSSGVGLLSLKLFNQCKEQKKKGAFERVTTSCLRLMLSKKLIGFGLGLQKRYRNYNTHIK